MQTLYKLIFSSGKLYIGQTVRTMQTRMAQHRRSAMNGNSQLPIHCAWRKYGEPSVEIIGEYESPEALHEAEIAAIQQYNTLSPNGYNVTHGGDTAPSKAKSVAAKISAKAKGRKHSAEVIAAVAEASKAHWQDPEYQQKVSDGLKASWTPERRAAAAERMRIRVTERRASGWTMPQEQRDKIAAKVITAETRQRMSESAKARVREPFSAETCSKISANTKQAWKNEEITQKRIAAIKAAWDDETREKMAKKAANSWNDPIIRERRVKALREAFAKKKLQQK